MEYLVLLAALGAFLIVIFIREAGKAQKEKKAFIRSLYDEFGQPPKKEHKPERYARIGGYFDRHRSEEFVDDITWNDLNMDEVFRRLDYTFSATGEEYLYAMLRDMGRKDAELAHLEEMIVWFDGHVDERVNVQLLMKKLGRTGKFSLYDYIEQLDYLGERSNKKHVIMNLLYLPLAALLPFQFLYALLGIVVLMIWQITAYFKEKGEIEPYIISFFYVMRLIDACRELSRLQIPVCEAQQEAMKRHIRELHGVRGGSFWVFSGNQGKMTGNPLDAVMDYIRMIFHVDLIVFNKMLAQLRLHLEDVDGLVEQAGRMEAAISIGAFRASLANGWCVPEFSESAEGKTSELQIREAYHPLLATPVKNSLRTERGILLTGSNASGKSTFLKTVAVNAVLAQTIHTCTAEAYQAPFGRVYSSMALRDDIESGESYYIVEIKSLKRILDAVQQTETEHPVFCFVDEVLRGTNTVERIAASVQILKSLAGNGVFCFAATHDIELTELLKEDYDNYHFEEEVVDGDISFNYKLLDGKAETRNAIKLLEIMGYNAGIIDKAEEMAHQFVETGVWQA